MCCALVVDPPCELSALFGADVRTALAPLDDLPVFRYAEEHALVARAVKKRQREFATGRRLAHELLEASGAAREPLLLAAGTRRPAWPRGVTGSISHSAELCGVAVARGAGTWGLGLDVERAEPLEERLWGRVLRAEERDALSTEHSGLEAKMVFGAKECAYKLLSPALARVLEFHEMRLEWEAAPGGAGRPVAWSATLLAEGAGVPAGFEVRGRLVRARGHVLCASQLAHEPA